MALELKDGGTYRMRNGGSVRVSRRPANEIGHGSPFLFMSPERRETYTRDGHTWPNSENPGDLVEEVTEVVVEPAKPAAVLPQAFAFDPLRDVNHEALVAAAGFPAELVIVVYVSTSGDALSFVPHAFQRGNLAMAFAPRISYLAVQRVETTPLEYREAGRSRTVVHYNMYAANEHIATEAQEAMRAEVLRLLSHQLYNEAMALVRAYTSNPT